MWADIATAVAAAAAADDDNDDDESALAAARVPTRGSDSVQTLKHMRKMHYY